MHPISRPQDSRFPYLPGIDALRALAVLAVFFYHSSVGWMPGGFLGVDVFFVISGYLITSLLLREFRRGGHVRLGRFWLRRARRLLPAVGVLIAVTMIAAAIVEPDRIDQLRGDAIASLAYCRQLALRPRRPVLLRPVPAPLALHPPLVALGRGAVLPLLAARLRRRDEAVRARPAAARGGGRGARLGRARLDPLRPRPRRLPRLLRHRHPRGRAAGGSGAGHGLEPGRAAPAPYRSPRRPRPRRRRRPRARLHRPQLPPRPRLRPGAVARRLPLAGPGHGAAAGGAGPPGVAARRPARAGAGALARPAQLLLLPLALPGADADPPRPRRLPPARRPRPSAATGGPRPRRPLLPLRRAPLPRPGQAAARCPTTGCASPVPP